MDDAFVRELLADHSRNPRHYGQLAEPDVECQTRNPQCVGPTHPEGDRVTLRATLSDDDPPVVESVRFTGAGCTLSQASASLVSQQLVGTPVDEAVDWGRDTVEDLVGMELTPSRLQCAELVLLAFRRGVANCGVALGDESE
ncbi:MAG: iron-sulfur cluster assembly scaffold protein [Haloferacaceae archaeon]